MLQVNAYVPSNFGSGARPIVLTIGENSNAQQQVMVAVQQTYSRPITSASEIARKYTPFHSRFHHCPVVRRSAKFVNE